MRSNGGIMLAKLRKVGSPFDLVPGPQSTESDMDFPKTGTHPFNMEGQDKSMTVSASLTDLDRLRELQRIGFQDSFVESALRRIVERQIARDEADLARVNVELLTFERQNQTSSDEFWRRYQSGEITDTADHMEWNVLVKMRNRIQTRLSILRA